MKKLILAFMLFAAIKSNAQQFRNTQQYSKLILDSFVIKPSISSLYSYSDRKSWSRINYKIHIDSAYLQMIIEALEERGYTLVKLPKKLTNE